MGQSPTEEALPAPSAPVPIWKVAVIGFSFMSAALAIGLSPAYAVQLAGSGAAAAQALGVGAMLAIAAAVSAFARRHVVSGSLMSYVFFTFGRGGRAVVGGFQLCGYLAMAASISAVTQIFLVGALSDLGVTGSAVEAQAVSIVLLIAGATFFTCRGLEASVAISVWIAALSVPPVFFVVIMAAVRQGVDVAPQFDFAHMSIDGIVQGALATLAFLIAFEGLSTLAAETANPKRDIPRLIYLILGVTGGAAVAATFVEAPLLMQHKSLIDSGVSPIGLMSQLAGVPWMQLPCDILLVIAGFASMIAVFTFGARVFATAGLDGVLPAWLGHTSGRAKTPRRGAMVVGVATAIALLVPMFAGKVSPVALGSIYGAAVVTFWIVPYATICLAAIVQEMRERSFHPLVLLGSAVGFLVMLFMMYQTLTTKADPALAWIPWGVLAAACPLAVWVYVRSGRHEVSDY